MQSPKGYPHALSLTVLMFCNLLIIYLQYNMDRQDNSYTSYFVDYWKITGVLLFI